MAWYHEAAQPPDWEDIDRDNPPVGLPRPQYRSTERQQTYPIDFKNTRRLYRKVPVPWNTENINRAGIPKFDKDIIADENYNDLGDLSDLAEKYGDDVDSLHDILVEHNSQSLRNKCCPMCGGQFQYNDPAVRFTNSNITSTLSDWLPYHPHCMELVKKHCPHLRYTQEPYTFQEGQYGVLLENGLRDWANAVNTRNG